MQRNITDARDLAQKMREAVRDGLDPSALLTARDPNKMTFRVYAEELIEAKRRVFKSEKWGKQWAATLKRYVYPGIGHKRASDVTPVIARARIWHFMARCRRWRGLTGLRSRVSESWWPASEASLYGAQAMAYVFRGTNCECGSRCRPRFLRDPSSGAIPK